MWDAANGQETLTLKGHTQLVTSVAFSPDGKRIVSGSWDKTIKVWDAASGQRNPHPQGAHERGHERGVQPGRQTDRQRQLRTRRSRCGTRPAASETLTLKGHTNEVTSVAFSPDGKRIVSGSRDNTVKVWDAASGQETLTLKGHTSWSRAWRSAPTGNGSSAEATT